MPNSVRMAVAITSAVVLVGGLGALTWRDLAVPAAPAPELEPALVQVDSGSSRVVCPGQLANPTEDTAGDDLIYDPNFDPRPTNVSAHGVGLVGGSGGGQSWLVGSSQRRDWPGPLAAVAETVDPAPLVLAAESTADSSSLAGGGVLIDTADGDLRGLAGASCLTPTSDAYILGGSTEVGASTRLSLVNPGGTAVNVDLTLWGPAGPVEAVGATGMTLPPNSQRVMRLEGLIGDASGLGLRVTASGGEIITYLQHSRLDGLVSAGVDFALPGAAPSTELTLGGIVSMATTLDTTDPTILRVLAPGSTGAKVSVKIFGPSGLLDLPATEDLTVPAGEVTDVPLLGLPEGIYAAFITSDEPILAAAMSTRFGDNAADPREIAWSAAGTTPLTGYLPIMSADVKIAVTAGAALRFSYRTYQANGAGSDAQVKDIEAGQTIILSPAELAASPTAIGLSYALDTPGAVAIAAVILADDGTKLTVLTPSDAMAAARTVAVRPI